MEVNIYGIIYLWTNTINQNKYVGKTIQTLEARTRQHLNDANNGSSYPLHRAIRKYGLSSFKIEVIKKAKEEKLSDLEIKYIKYYDSYKNGYNATLGGDGHSTKTNGITFKEAKKIYDDYLNMTFHELITKYNMCRDVIINLFNSYDLPLKNKINFSYSTQNLCRSVKQYDENHNLVATHKKLADACVAAGICYYSTRLLVKAHKEKKLYHGYYWVISNVDELKNQAKPKKVGAFKDNKMVLSFKSAFEAGKQGFSSSRIVQLCKGVGGRKHHKGYEWKYI